MDLEVLLKQSPREVRKQCGIPHPLSNFATSGIKDEDYADLLVDCVNDLVLYDSGLKHESARWVLFESDVFFNACAKAGIDGTRFRDHLLKVEAGEFVEED